MRETLAKPEFSPEHQRKRVIAAGGSHGSVIAEIPSVEPKGQPSQDSMSAGQCSPKPNGTGNAWGDLGVCAGDEDPGGIRATITELWQKLFSEFCPGNSLVALEPDTDFFAAGGSSIIAVMMLSGVYEEFGVNVSFGALMEEPTIRALSQRVIQLMRDEGDRTCTSFQGM